MICWMGLLLDCPVSLSDMVYMRLLFHSDDGWLVFRTAAASANDSVLKWLFFFLSDLDPSKASIRLHAQCCFSHE